MTEQFRTSQQMTDKILTHIAIVLVTTKAKAPFYFL